MTTIELLHHRFPWEFAPGVPADEDSTADDDE
jgi:hypothetical protein